MKRAALAVITGVALASLAQAGTARANGVDDGNAGLSALQNGDYDVAIRLFSRALDSRGLKGDDREFAYANRGVAYLKKGDVSSAIVDLDRARQMKPDDADAQNELVTAVAMVLPASLVPGQSARSVFHQLGSALGNSIMTGIQQGLAQSAQQQQ